MVIKMTIEEYSVIFPQMNITHDIYENRIQRDQKILEEMFAKQEKDDIYMQDPEEDEKKPICKNNKNWKDVEDPVLRKKMRNRICAERARKKKADMICALISENEMLKQHIKNLEEELLRLKK